MPQVLDRHETAGRTTGGHGGFASFAWALVVGLAAVVGAFALSAANHDGAALAVVVAGVAVALVPVVRNGSGGVDRRGLAGASAGLLVVVLLVALAVGWFLWAWSNA